MFTRLDLNLTAATVTMISFPNIRMVLFVLVVRNYNDREDNPNDKDNTIKNNDSNLGNDDCNNECVRDGHTGSN